MQPLLYIVVRRTTDWTCEAAVRAQLPDGFAPLVDLWNETFDMPYHHFRQRLKDIAAMNLAGVVGAVTADITEVPSGALIAPVDDDDWFAPEMATAVARHRHTYRGYRWPSRFLEVPPDFGQWRGAWRRRLFPNAPLRFLCTTNNYVVENMPDVRSILRSHMRASDWFEQHSSSVKSLDTPLSIQNRNLASQTTLLFRTGVMTRARLVRRHRQYRALYARPRRHPAWCRPSIARMAELMEAIHVRR